MCAVMRGYFFIVSLSNSSAGFSAMPFHFFDFNVRFLEVSFVPERGKLDKIAGRRRAAIGLNKG